MAVSKVVYNGSTLIDLTGDTVAADKLLEGYTAHDKAGAKITGTYTPVDLSKDTVTADKLLAGCTAHNASGTAITGTMVNQGAKTATLNCGGSYTIPAGYHNGSGKVTANSLASQTDGDATAEQILSGKIAYVDGAKVTGTMPNLTSNATITHTSTNSTKVIIGDAGFITTNSDDVKRYEIRYNGPSGYITGNTLFALPYNTVASNIGLTAAKIAKGQTILGIAGTYTSDATATAAQILSGKTAYVNGSKITGTMAAQTIAEKFDGFQPVSTTWSTSSVTSTDAAGNKIVSTRSTTGTVTEVYTGKDGSKITRVSKVNGSGKFTDTYTHSDGTKVTRTTTISSGANATYTYS